jgi:hypothetical protein
VRRRVEEALNADGVPSWLSSYDPARWADPDDRQPADWGFGAAMWRLLRGHARWADAGQQWLASRDRRAEWFTLTRHRAMHR